MYYMYYIYYYTCKKLGTLMDMVYASIYDPEIGSIFDPIRSFSCLQLLHTQRSGPPVKQGEKTEEETFW